MVKIAAVIQGFSNPLRLEGHTDSMPIHNPRFRSNWELSAARSIPAMLELLRQKFGIAPERMSVAGYAENAPVDSNETGEGRAHNRRVDLVILSEEAAKSEPGAAGRDAEAYRSVRSRGKGRAARQRLVLVGGMNGVETLLILRPRAQRNAFGPLQEFLRFGHAFRRAGTPADLLQDGGGVTLPMAQYRRPIATGNSLAHVAGAFHNHHWPLASIWSETCWALNKS